MRERLAWSMASFMSGERDAGELEVELEAGDAVLGAAQLEVHVAVVIFRSRGCRRGGGGASGCRCSSYSVTRPTEMPATGRLDRHARVHEGEDAAADRGHRGRAVGLHDFGRDADGVGEVVLLGDDGEDGTLGERAVADFAAVQAADAAGLTDREGREVVVEDETLGRLAAGVAVEVLRLVAGRERRQAERLRLAAGEERGTVRARAAGRLRRRAGGFPRRRGRRCASACRGSRRGTP